VTQLFSKILAGGLSAGVILLWWPLVFPSDTVESWLVRGVLWTLSFELLLHAFAPIEESFWRSRAARLVRSQAQAVGTRLGARSQRTRSGGRTALAGFALAVPVALLTAAPPHQPVEHVPAKTVRHVTEVKRIVKVERREVTVPVAAQAATAPAPVAPRAAASPARRGAAAGRRARTPTPEPTGERSGGGSAPAAGTTDPAAETPPQQPAMGSDERSAVAPVVAPK
jgi:hypothetical protein